MITVLIFCILFFGAGVTTSQSKADDRLDAIPIGVLVGVCADIYLGF